MNGPNSFVSCVNRVQSIVLYFGIPLGILSLLRHLQGEQIPWNASVVYYFVGSNATGFLYMGDKSTNWSMIDRWTKNHSLPPFEEGDIAYGDSVNWTPGKETLYNKFTLTDGLIINTFCLGSTPSVL